MKQKTLQEQYNLIQEGKGNAEVFMKAAKKQFSGFVRNAATLNETVSSLKRNHIISENILGLGMVSTNKSTTPDWFKIFNENMETIKEEAKAVEKKPTKDVVDMETKGYDYKNQDELNNMNFEEFLRGYYTELKNPKNADKTEQELKDIVKKNLIKNSLYYVENAQFGIEGIGYTDQLPGLKASKSDQMVPVKLKENRVTAEDWETYVELERGDTSKDYVELERGDTYNSLLGKAKRYVALHGGVSPQDFMKEFNIDIKTAQSLINDLPNNNRIDENKKNINEVGVLAIAGGTALGILGAAVGYKAFKFLKRGISNAASSVAIKVDDMLQDKLTKQRMEKHKSLIIGALNRLKSDPEFENYVELLLSNPNSGTPDMKTTSGKIRVKRKGDYNDMRKLRSSTIKDFKTYLTKNLTPEEQSIFHSIYDAASQGEGKSIPENKNKNNVKNVGEGRTSLLSILKEDYALGEKPKTPKAPKPKKETTDSRLSEIDKNGKIATLEIQIEALDEIINSKNDRISMVTEDDNLSELVDSKKMKEMQREIKLLEKRKLQMEKLYEKMCGNKYSPKEVVDEIKNEE